MQDNLNKIFRILFILFAIFRPWPPCAPQSKPISSIINKFSGIRSELDLTFDYITVPSFGSTDDLCGLLNFSTEFDLHELAGLTGSVIYCELIGIKGCATSCRLGTFQCVSNIEAPSMIRIYEAWVKQNFFGRDFYLLAGVRDFNSSFDAIENASIFLNSSHGLGCELSQTGTLGPSTYPHTGLALEMCVNPTTYLEWRNILLEAIPGNYELSDWDPSFFDIYEGYLIASEVGYSFDIFPQEEKYQRARGKGGRRRHQNRGSRFRERKTFSEYGIENSDFDSELKLGIWYYTSDFEDTYQKFTRGCSDRRSGNMGLYFSFQNGIPLDPSINSNLMGFIRFGIANPDLNTGSYYFGTGLTFTNPMGRREENSIGISAAVLGIGHKYKSAMNELGKRSDNFEGIFELTMRYGLLDMLIIQPDLQYILNPGADPELRDELVIIVRTELSL